MRRTGEEGMCQCNDLGKLVCFSQKPIENKEDKSLLDKMHFKPIGSSAVVELHKLTDYNSGHCDKEQIHFRFLGKIFELQYNARTSEQLDEPASHH